MNNAPIRSPLHPLGAEWANWFKQAADILIANEQSGTTANRPTGNLWIGRRYYDTTLNKPVFVSAVSPSIVWRDAAGTSV